MRLYIILYLSFCKDNISSILSISLLLLYLFLILYSLFLVIFFKYNFLFPYSWIKYSSKSLDFGNLTWFEYAISFYKNGDIYNFSIYKNIVILFIFYAMLISKYNFFYGLVAFNAINILYYFYPPFTCCINAIIISWVILK